MLAIRKISKIFIHKYYEKARSNYATFLDRSEKLHTFELLKPSSVLLRDKHSLNFKLYNSPRGTENNRFSQIFKISSEHK